MLGCCRYFWPHSAILSYYQAQITLAQDISSIVLIPPVPLTDRVDSRMILQRTDSISSPCASPFFMEEDPWHRPVDIG